MKYNTICTALYDYKAQNEEEISFNADNILYILDKEDLDWYKAQLKVPSSQDGPIGLIPANYIEKAKSIGSVKAIYDYTSQSEEELSFKQDEVLTLYEKDDPDWFIIENSKGDIGLAPSNYVEETTDTRPQTIQVESKPSVNINKAKEHICEPKWAITLYAFHPESEEETYLNDHEQVLVTDYVSNKDWWTIEHKDGTAGIVPASYVKFQDEYEADLRKEEEEEKKKELALKEQKLKEENETRDRELAERNRQRELEEKEKARQLEVERRRKMQDEAKQKEIEAKRQASFAANAMASPQLGGGSPRRSQIPAPPPPTRSTPDPSPPAAPAHNDPTKPDPSRVRMWTDRTGAFKVEAQFILCGNGKIRLHKTNGVKIDVPTQKMCVEDLRYIEHETGMKLIEDKSDNIPLGQLNHRFTWLDLFKRANVPHNACLQYAKSFDQNNLTEQDVDRLTHRQMKSLGMTERHVQRVQKFIETSQADPPSEDESTRPKVKTKKTVTFGAVSYIHEEGDDDDDMGNVQWQIEQDERLARELQEQEQGSNNHVSLQRRGTGRPTPAQSAPIGVNASILTPQKFSHEPLKPTPAPPPPAPQQNISPQQHVPLQPSPKNVIPTPPKSNFEDDAWSPRVGSSPSVQTVTPPVWNQQQQRSINNNNTPPQMPPRQRPTPTTSQQSLVDPQLLAKWGGSPALAAANYNRPVPPPPTSSAPTLNSLPTGQQQPSFYQQQQPTGSFTNLQSNGSFTSLPVNNSFTNFQQQSPLQQQQQQLPIQQQQTTGFTPQMYNNQQTLQPTGQSFIGSSPVPLQSILPPPLTPQPPLQSQMTTGRSWAAATPDNPFGGASPAVVQNQLTYQQQSFVAPQNTGYVPQYVPQQQQYNAPTIDPNDKYAVFKTVNTSAPSVFNQRF